MREWLSPRPPHIVVHVSFASCVLVGIMVVLLNCYLSSVLVAALSQGSVLAGHASTSLALPHGRTMVPGWLPLNPCEGGEYSSPCCYN